MSTSFDSTRRPEAQAAFDRSIDELKAGLERLGSKHLDAILALAQDVYQAWQQGGKLLICGNGGSAADSQHIAAELLGRFLQDRPGYPAVALTTNSSILTAVGTDIGFDHIFARQVQGLAGPQDVLLVISTSGNSANCVAAVDEARRKGLKVHAFLGHDGGRLLQMVDSALVAPSDHTPRIQEIHITMGHFLCLLLEKWMQEDG